MHGAGWIELFRKVPMELHDTLALGISSGREIVVQQLLRLDAEFMVLRGRTAGTNDGGRIMILPYGHLVSIAFNRKLAAVEVEKVFGASEFAPLADDEDALFAAEVAAANAAANGGAAAAPGSPPAPASPTASAPSGAPAAAGPAKPLSKSILLARLRERLAEKAK